MKRESVPQCRCILAENLCGINNLIVESGDLKKHKFWSIVPGISKETTWMEFLIEVYWLAVFQNFTSDQHSFELFTMFYWEPWVFNQL